MTRISVSHLHLERGRRAILHDLSLELDSGALIVVIGPNGAGKSTLMSALAGLEPPTSGEVTLDGVSLQAIHRKALARTRAYLPQNPRSEWPLPVERLVALGLTPTLPPFGPLSPDLSARVRAAMEACDIAHLADQAATTLSGGELSRAMLARAIVGDPQVLIVDEPTTGLDPRHAIGALARLKGLAAAGRLVIASVHDLTLAARFGDRVIALADGRLAADGPVKEVLTPELLRRLFSVDATLLHTPLGPLVDIHAAA